MKFSGRRPSLWDRLATFNLSGMGIKFFDYDNDGNPDIIFPMATPN